jgi:hypothetical protein
VPLPGRAALAIGFVAVSAGLQARPARDPAHDSPFEAACTPLASQPPCNVPLFLLSLSLWVVAARSRRHFHPHQRTHCASCMQQRPEDVALHLSHWASSPQHTFSASRFPTMQGHRGCRTGEGAARGDIEAVTCGTVTSVQGGLTMRYLSYWPHHHRVNASTTSRPCGGGLKMRHFCPIGSIAYPVAQAASADPASPTTLHDAAHRRRGENEVVMRQRGSQSPCRPADTSALGG